ncbi:MAG: acyl-CoA dehydratase activase [Eubacteriales bacterium]
MINVGIDIGSTTAKVVVMDQDAVVFQRYERHFSQVRQKTVELLREARPVLEGKQFRIAISGSAGFGVSKAADVEFVQEVFATGEAVKAKVPDTDIVIELGGEDAKIIFLTGGLEERMNGTCAGGTGAFIDQMATLLNVTTPDLDQLSLDHHTIYPIASRCGVFAKTDIQPLLNQGARKEDIAASIYQAVVDQTITGLAQGREITGKILFLGGPLYFLKGLQQRFVETLKLNEDTAVFPDFAPYAVAIGAAMYASANGDDTDYDTLLQKLENSTGEVRISRVLPPLFRDREEYDAFLQRHGQATIREIDPAHFTGDAYLGIDCGSTTTKLALVNDEGEILYQYYGPNKGNPVVVIREQLTHIWKICGDHISIKASVVTGYGEELIKNAFDTDAGIVETMAHFKAARHFCPQVDFILDIGGQDMKCFKIKNDSIDSIMLNEACSSGCGSFLETFARSMGYDIQEFAQRGLFSQQPVDLGSRCTVFMNSSVKQAQKEGASVEDISAGLSMSVVKNAIYKVIRAHSADELGEYIVVQGGTFLNDAVLRSFEQELGRNVIRPAIAGLMGAYGAALYGRDMGLECSTLMGPDALEHFTHSAKPVTCGLCTNHCSLTVNQFAGGRRFISGNKCGRPLGQSAAQDIPDIFAFKLDRIRNMQPVPGPRGKIGMPLGLNMYENIQFWNVFLSSLGFEVVFSDISSQEMYAKGRYSIPSDTACYPAKLMHGHIEDLLEKGITTIFYPCLTYNFDEHSGDNHFNCPVVAYYPELLHANVKKLRNVQFLYPYLGIHKKDVFIEGAHKFLTQYWPDITHEQVIEAADAAYAAHHQWQNDLKIAGREAMAYAREHGKKIIVLAGRPYHVDPEINHGIAQLIRSLGLVVITEDCVSDLVVPYKAHVLNQWTYHARLYNAAKYVTQHDDMELVQLVSFGCGIDAITTDEVREILENKGKFYTQLKIDEINNLGAVKIRIRSLIAAMEERERNQTKKKRKWRG